MKIVHDTLVMAIDGEKMLLLRNEGDRKFMVLETLGHDELDNPPTREQGTDAPGRAFSSTGDRRSAMGETDWHRQAEEHFAKAGAERLERAAAGNEDDIVVIRDMLQKGIELEIRQVPTDTKQMLENLI